jgi:uridine kinase
LVAVDGGAGAGKTVFADRLGAALSTASTGVVLHTDDFLDGWTDIVTFWPRLQQWVLDPLAAGQPGAYRPYDWDAGAFSTVWHPVSVVDVILLEGVSAARHAIRDGLSYAVWIETPPAVRLARGIERDGEHLRGEWERWQRAEDAHFAADKTAGAADLIVDGDPPPAIAYDRDREFVAIRPGGPRVSPSM